jgi:hypothetical protein
VRDNKKSEESREQPKPKSFCRAVKESNGERRDSSEKSGAIKDNLSPVRLINFLIDKSQALITKHFSLLGLIVAIMQIPKAPDGDGKLGVSRRRALCNYQKPIFMQILNDFRFND